jgi:hypothetical protein
MSMSRSMVYRSSKSIAIVMGSHVSNSSHRRSPVFGNERFKPRHGTFIQSIDSPVAIC